MMMMMDDYDDGFSSTGWTKVAVVLDQTGASE
jgi:hypothetical protein